MDSSIEIIRAAAADSGAFAEIRTTSIEIGCRAKESAAEAWYRVRREQDRWVVSLETPDRWLSESIEADLMHFGDPLEELVEEELIELGWSGSMPGIKHYRSDDMQYTFKVEVPATGDAADDARTAALWLLAFEAAFRELGDMTGEDEE